MVIGNKFPGILFTYISLNVPRKYAPSNESRDYDINKTFFNKKCQGVSDCGWLQDFNNLTCKGMGRLTSKGKLGIFHRLTEGIHYSDPINVPVTGSKYD